MFEYQEHGNCLRSDLTDERIIVNPTVQFLIKFLVLSYLAFCKKLYFCLGSKYLGLDNNCEINDNCSLHPDPLKLHFEKIAYPDPQIFHRNKSFEFLRIVKKEEKPKQNKTKKGGG